MAAQQYIVIVGCGKLGSYLANHLSRLGHGVVVVDRDERAFVNLSPEYSGFRIEGDATELAVLKQAKADKADLVVSATSNDNVNLMVAQVAKKVLGVARVLARVFEPRRESVYRGLGVETVCPTSVAAGLFLQSISGEHTPCGS